jgi:hypothetical protein
MPAVAAVGISACPGFGPRGLRYRIRRHDAAGTGHPPSGPCGLTLQLEDRPLVKDLLTSGGRRGPVPGCSRCVVGRAGALVAACRAFGDGGARRRKVGRPSLVRSGPARRACCSPPFWSSLSPQIRSPCPTGRPSRG